MNPLLTFLLVSCVAWLSGCASLARKAVLPGSYLQPPQTTVAASPDFELLTLHTRDGTKLAAQFARALDHDGHPLPDSSARPTVLFLYGNRMCLAASQGILGDLRRMGVNVCIPEYPGYGMSDGSPSEQGCYAAADAAYEHLLHREDIDRRQIVVAGLSVGGGPAVDLASRERVAGLILVVPFTRIRDVGHDDLAWYLRWAVPLVASHVSFNNVAKLPRVTCPVLLVQAKRDQVTSAQRSEQLAAAATAPLARVTVDADHDGAWQAGLPEVERWLAQTFKTAERAAGPAAESTPPAR